MTSLKIRNYGHLGLFGSVWADWAMCYYHHCQVSSLSRGPGHCQAVITALVTSQQSAANNIPVNTKLKIC